VKQMIIKFGHINTVTSKMWASSRIDFRDKDTVSVDVKRTTGNFKHILLTRLLSVTYSKCCWNLANWLRSLLDRRNNRHFVCCHGNKKACEASDTTCSYDTSVMCALQRRKNERIWWVWLYMLNVEFVILVRIYVCGGDTSDWLTSF